MIDPGLAAVFASLVFLALGVASIARGSGDFKKTAKLERMQRQNAAYVDLLRVVAKRGLAVQDEMYNFTETQDDDFHIDLPQRRIDAPQRSDRAEALALVAAYGTPVIRGALDAWLEAIDDWDRKRDGFIFEFQLNGPSASTEKMRIPSGLTKLLPAGPSKRSLAPH